MATTARKQDMPPPGGFRPINYERIKARTYFSGPQMFLGFFGITAAASYLYIKGYKNQIRQQVEVRSSLFAILPVMFAERDRAFLKQLKVNRDLEADLMKNVEGWEVGTYYGEPIYKTKDPDYLIEPRIREYFIHSSWKDASKRIDIRHEG
ncbi:NADH dehydrogenase [ubiquinone] 1 alpha subcomplex subunit 13-like [Macrosteles quadrilineatus]|uniref:NADH dehydrogenase [ubiquinone] 1 alpha subcomplex subunit 13-like n=1 Tax=Macrosteles quadrilineatus TaxID=74068 RepID=UPI0023E2FB46|nr:NADH dehydrogenase [ubiquinone] 1 alpha subcomplex subunit 13-like [Macrosteles quadrilineatus]XP_054287954.1 NADH dehydrogenase [ubiquinone] 1 alpha subcomplex subunit 13-like [Macrosteles quadrilineatus]